MRRIRPSLLMIVWLAAMAAPAVRAQEQPSGQPPAMQSTDENEATDMNGNTLTPDTRSLAGVQTISLGVPALQHSYWQPSFNAVVAGDSSPLLTPGSSSWTSWTTLLGSVDVRAVSGRSDFTLDYVGGGSLSNDATVQNAIVQEAQLGERISGRRVSLAFLDQALYIPETSFGYGGLSALSLPGGAVLGVQPSLVPSETILSARGQRLINSSLVEIDALVTHRLTFTVAGGYALLHYYNDDPLDFNNAIGQAGLSFDLSRHDAIGLVYRYNSYRFPNGDETLIGHIGELTYGRRVTGKLAFEIGGGAEYAIFRLPGLPSTVTSWPNSVYWIADGSLSYALRRTVMTLGYDHGVAGGSGVLSGALGDTVTGSVSSQFSRTLRGDFTGGYARSSELSIVSSTKSTSSPTFDYFFGTAGLTRPWGRNMTISLGYLVQYQSTSATYCIGTACGTSILRHQISLGFNVHTRPYAIE